MDKPVKSVTHGQCNATPVVTSPARGHHSPLTSTKLYCLVTEAHMCEQLAQGCYLKAKRPTIEHGFLKTAFKYKDLAHSLCVNQFKEKGNVAHTRLQSIWFWSWSRFLAVSLQVTWIINPTVGCHYFPPGVRLPLQSLRGLLPTLLLGEQRHNGCEQFA